MAPPVHHWIVILFPIQMPVPVVHFRLSPARNAAVRLKVALLNRRLWNAIEVMLPRLIHMCIYMYDNMFVCIYIYTHMISLHV